MQQTATTTTTTSEPQKRTNTINLLDIANDLYEKVTNSVVPYSLLLDGILVCTRIEGGMLGSVSFIPWKSITYMKFVPEQHTVRIYSSHSGDKALQLGPLNYLEQEKELFNSYLIYLYRMGYLHSLPINNNKQ